MWVSSLAQRRLLESTVLTSLCVWLAAGAAHGQQSARNAELYQQAKRASVEVLVDDHLDGSGWFADAQGLVITAAHVVGRPDRRIEVLSPLAGRLTAKVLAVDLGHDLALLAVDRRDGGYPALPLAAELPSPGEELFLLGAPIFRHAVLLRGTMACDDTVFEYYLDRYTEVMLVAATVPGGMSGGPWLNAAGEVVGIQVSVMSLNAVPVGVASVSPLGAIRDLLKKRRTTATPTIGAAVEEPWQQDRKFLDRFPPRTEGLVIRSLQHDGPAARAGLKQWDVIVAADGKKVRLVDELLRIIRAKAPGQPLELTVLGPDGIGGRKASVPLGKLEAGWPQRP